MNIRRQTWIRASLVIGLAVLITAASTRLHADSGTCGGRTVDLPFTDVSGNAFFCQIAAAYFSGLTAGTSATTYSPTQNVTREQMAAFITRTQDSALRRGSRRAALNQWTQGSFSAGGMTTVGAGPISVQSDGADLWVANNTDHTVSRVRASDGKLLDTWTAAIGARSVLVARGRIFVTGSTAPGKLYRIDPQLPAAAVTVVTSSLGDFPSAVTTDGNFIWTANSNSVSRVNPGNGDVTTFTTGFNQPTGILYDGSHLWVTEFSPGKLLRLNPDGTIAQSIDVGTGARYAVFDGLNIWVPNSVANTVSVVRVKDAQGNPLPAAFALTTLDANGLVIPITAAFDGQRILITNSNGDSVSLWKATDLTPLGSFFTGTDTNPSGACSDGLNFWVALNNTNKLARF